MLTRPASSRKRNAERTAGWSCRLEPTPGRSATTSMPCSARWLEGPTPDAMSTCGLWMAPAASSTSPPALRPAEEEAPVGRTGAPGCTATHRVMEWLRGTQGCTNTVTRTRVWGAAFCRPYRARRAQPQQALCSAGDRCGAVKTTYLWRRRWTCSEGVSPPARLSR